MGRQTRPRRVDGTPRSRAMLTCGPARPPSASVVVCKGSTWQKLHRKHSLLADKKLQTFRFSDHRAAGSDPAARLGNHSPTFVFWSPVEFFDPPSRTIPGREPKAHNMYVLILKTHASFRAVRFPTPPFPPRNRTFQPYTASPYARSLGLTTRTGLTKPRCWFAAPARNIQSPHHVFERMMYPSSLTCDLYLLYTPLHRSVGLIEFFLKKKKKKSTTPFDGVDGREKKKGGGIEIGYDSNQKIELQLSAVEKMRRAATYVTKEVNYTFSRDIYSHPTKAIK